VRDRLPVYKWQYYNFEARIHPSSHKTRACQDVPVPVQVLEESPKSTDNDETFLNPLLSYSRPQTPGPEKRKPPSPLAKFPSPDNSLVKIKEVDIAKIEVEIEIKGVSNPDRYFTNFESLPTE